MSKETKDRPKIYQHTSGGGHEMVGNCIKTNECMNHPFHTGQCDTCGTGMTNFRGFKLTNEVAKKIFPEKELTPKEALEQLRKECKSTYFDEIGKQWWTSNKGMDYRCNIISKALDKLETLEKRDTPMKVIENKCVNVLYNCPECNENIEHLRFHEEHINYCPNCGQSLLKENDDEI